MKNLELLREELIKFREERDWKQFHNPKDLAISMLLEAGEVLEHFQWRSVQEVEEYIKDNRSEIAGEVADVLKYLILLCDSLGIDDIVEIAIKKLESDGAKYPVVKSRGRHIKYNQL